MRQMEQGYDLRSRCQLRAKKKPTIEILGAIEGNDISIECSSQSAISLFNQALSVCETSGLEWEKKDIVLSPSESLLRAVQNSRLAHIASEED
jgi:hypothetical protein